MWYSIYEQSFNVMPFFLLKISKTFFPSQDIKQNVLLSSYLENWWCNKLKIYLQSTSKAMADREKREEDGNSKIWISWDWKGLFRWNEKHFS